MVQVGIQIYPKYSPKYGKSGVIIHNSAFLYKKSGQRETAFVMFSNI